MSTYHPPIQVRPTSVTVTSQSLESLGIQTRTLVGTPYVSTAFPAANRVILVPFTLTNVTTFASLAVANGATVSGNFDIGIYDTGGGTATLNRLVSTGSTAQSGTSVPQSVAASFTLGPGTYFAALCCDKTTATFLAKTPSAAGIGAAQLIREVADNGSVTLGATLTTIPLATAYVPLFGPSQKATV